LCASIAPGISAESFLDASFQDGTEAFVYSDDTFLGTQAPDQASGRHLPEEGGSTPGALEIVLGDAGATTVRGISAGWVRSFTLSDRTHNVEIAFRYRLTQAAAYEGDEFSQVMLSLDGKSAAGAGGDFIVRIAGDGDGGETTTTGWRLSSTKMGTLAAGPHRLTIGGFNNKKTAEDESTQILIDDVRLTGDRVPPCGSDLDCDDDNPCTNDACVAGSCRHRGQASACPDGFDYDD
jgi:hypothetical protein